MISKEEIRAKSQELEVRPINVQRDYVFGWLLFAIYTSTELKDLLILKGGNCFRKAFFEHTRYSGDLDFSTQEPVDPEFLHDQLNRACVLTEQATGVRFETESSRVEEGWSADKDQRVFKARLYFQDFFGQRDEILVSVRVDISELDRIYLPLQERNLIHSYSDSDECRAVIRCVSLEEALAAKLKCLLQRRHIVDLYDLAYTVFVNHELDVDRLLVAQVFLQKTVFEPSPSAAVRILTGLPLEKLEEAWQRFVVCPKQSLMDFADTVAKFRQVVTELFASFPNRLSELAFFPPELRNPIMEAGSSLTLLKITYGGIPRVVEPYSLAFKKRKDGVAREYFYVYDRTGGRSGGPGIRSLVASGFSAIENTEEKFEPREEVVISKASEPGDKLYFGAQSPFYKRTRRPASSRRVRASGIVYVVECPYCNRQFKRTTRNLTLRTHRDSFGNQCYGRRGNLSSQEWA